LSTISIKELYWVWEVGMDFNSESKYLEKAGQLAFVKFNLLLKGTLRGLILAKISHDTGRFCE
jgi:hypothetical protein